MRDGETGRANEPVKAKEFYVIVKATGERGLLLNELIDNRPDIYFNVELDSGETKAFKFNELVIAKPEKGAGDKIAPPYKLSPWGNVERKRQARARQARLNLEVLNYPINDIV
jgi:hypothetical protein